MHDCVAALLLFLRFIASVKKTANNFDWLGS